MAELDDRVDEGPVVGVILDPVDERPVDLDDVDGQDLTEDRLE
jgi:hypothetical protein